MDLYAILGVPKDASFETIKDAHRKLAKEHHPDKGGDPGKFNSIQAAYDVLIDPEKRHRYDTTGMTEDGKDKRTAAISILVEFYFKALSENDSNLEDIVKIIETNINLVIESKTKNIFSLEDEMKTLEKAGKRIRKKSKGQNFLLLATEAKIKDGKKTIIEIQAVIDTLNEALRLVGDYTYETDSPISTAETITVNPPVRSPLFNLKWGAS